MSKHSLNQLIRVCDCCLLVISPEEASEMCHEGHWYHASRRMCVSRAKEEIERLKEIVIVYKRMGF